MNPKARDYVNTVHDETRRPFTKYPQKLTKHIFEKYGLQKGDKLLGIDCGRGEFLRGLIESSINGYVVDQSCATESYCPNAVIKTADLEKEPIPYDDNSFDLACSKSVIVHFLKPGGLVLMLCPDSYFNYRVYFEDVARRTPFMQLSLRDNQRMSRFEETEVGLFRQLPNVWRHSWLLSPCKLTRLFAPEFIRPLNKLGRFPKEIMLIYSSRELAAAEAEVL